MKSVAYCVVLLLAGVAAAQDKPKLEKKTSYFPLDEGATWTYTAQEKTFVVKVVGFEKVGDDVCAKMETRNEKKDLIATEWFTVKDDGVYRCKFADKAVTPPLMILKLPLPKDLSKTETWKFKSKVGDAEVEGTCTVSELKGVKVGGKEGKTYDTVVVTAKGFKIEDQAVTVTYYFADKVGVVKQVVEIGGSKTERDLEKFEEK